MNALRCISILSVLFSSTSSSTDINVTSAYQPGHVIFGGLFPAHLSWQEKCIDMNMNGIVLIEAMMYTVNKVNTEKLLPWNLTLGYDVRDTCDSKQNALKSTLSFLSEERYSSINEGSRSCGLHKSTLCDGKLVSIVGAGSTQLNIAVNNILSAFNIPQVGYASTSGILSDKSRFPSFSRTVVIGSNKPQVIAKIISHFGWKHVGLLVSDDLHWKSLSLEFKNLARAQGICIDIDELLSEDTALIGSVVSQVNVSKTTHIIVLFASLTDTMNVIQQASYIQLRSKLWISTDMLPSDIVNKHAETLQGMIVIDREPEIVNEFTNYFTSLNPMVNTWNPWFKMLWENMFHCRVPERAQIDLESKGDGRRTCSGKEKFGWVSQVLSFSNAIHVIDAVMSATHVIKNICKDIKSTNASTVKEQCLQKLTRQNILKQMFKGPFTFQSLYNRTVSLDKNGNVISSYTVFHLKQDLNGVQIHKAGFYKSYQDKLYITNDIIEWPRGFQPLESCGTFCEPGHYRDFEGSKCCWKCKVCQEGTFSSSINAVKCMTCPEGTRPNKRRTSCKKKLPKYYDWGDSGGVTLVAVSMISFFLAFIIFGLFLKYKSSAVVSGWGSDVNFFLLWSISIGVLVPFAFIGYPTDNMCKIQAVVVPTTLTLSLSLVWVKIGLITCKRKNMISRWRVVSYAQKQTINALFLTIIELLFCTLWVIISPPYVSTKTINTKEEINVCTNTNASWYVFSFLYLFSIVIVTTIRAFKSRNRPFNFSEAKLILFTMICIYITWGIYAAVFFSTSFGFHHTTLICLTTIATQIIILGFIFVPKIYILFWKPEMGKDCEFQSDDMYPRGPHSYEASNPRHLHPNGILRPHSASFRDDSSRGTASQVSLDLTPTTIPQPRTQASPQTTHPLVTLIARIPCCAGISRDDNDDNDDDSSQGAPYNHQRSYSAASPTSRRLPLIMIDEGTRSNSSQDRTITPRSTHSSRHRNIDDPDSLSATMDDNSEIWSRRLSTANHQTHRVDQQNEEYCLRYALNGRIIENKHLRRQPHSNDNTIRESRL